MGIGTKSSGPVDGKVLSAAMPFRVRGPAVPAGRRIREGTAARRWLAGPDRGISVGWGRGDEGGSFLERRFVVGLAIVCIRKSEGMRGE